MRRNLYNTTDGLRALAAKCDRQKAPFGYFGVQHYGAGNATRLQNVAHMPIYEPLGWPGRRARNASENSPLDIGPQKNVDRLYPRHNLRRTMFLRSAIYRSAASPAQRVFAEGEDARAGRWRNQGKRNLWHPQLVDGKMRNRSKSMETVAV